LGWKRLATPSTAAAAFLARKPDLAVTRAVAQLGPLGSYVPVAADQSNQVSLLGSFYFLEELLNQTGLPALETLDVIGSGQEFGTKIENKIASGLRELLEASGLPFTVASKGSHSGDASFQLTDYWPFSRPPTSADGPEVEEMYRRLGRGHLIQPDIVVWRSVAKPFFRVEADAAIVETHQIKQLVACISGKATIRSDRSQSSRYEGSTISRWRRSRAPHFVVVTAEPDPSRLGSLAWGLGEIDCVYHVSVAALYASLVRVEADLMGRPSTPKGFATNELRALIDNARIRDLSLLFDDLFAEALPR
jgi:hypothetical protein